MTVTTNVDLITDAAGTGSPTLKGMILTNATATPGNGISFSATDDAMQFLTPTTDISVALDNSHKVGRVVTIFNFSATKIITLVATDLSVIRTVYPGTCARVVPITATPAATAAWACLDEANSSWLSVAGSVSLIDSGNNNGFTNSAFTHLLFKRNGDTVRVRGDLTFSGAPTSSGGGATGLFVLLMPAALAPDTAKIFATNLSIVGKADHKAGGVERGAADITVNAGGVTVLGAFASQFRSALSAGVFGSTVPVAWQSGDRITFDLSYPVSGWSQNKG